MKSKMIILLIVSISFLTLSNSCENLMEKWYTIKIQNDSNNRFFVSAGCERYGLFSYPDTLLPTSKPSLLSVSPNDYNNLRSMIKWEEIIKEQPENKLSIYFFNADTIDKYEWPEIKTGYKVMKRFDLSLEDFQGMNWTITYP
jgi:hypothetical protein